ncbi:MAG: class I SAM-dependent methyltransferase [Dissulfurispiraceae bacterium]
MGYNTRELMLEDYKMDTVVVKDTWKQYWIQNKKIKWFLDHMSKTILAELLRNCGGVSNTKVLEAGCGSGVISAEVATFGADVHLMDISRDALEVARASFFSRDVPGSFIQGDIFYPPFETETFDLVWNAGVLEHFGEESQSVMIRNIARIIKPGGFFIVFNPYERALFYRIGKKFAERKGIWPYGPEIPVKSLRDKCIAAGFTVLHEYPICFDENLLFISYVSKYLKSVLKLMFRPFSEQFLIKTFGGYLLATVAVKNK